MKPGEIHWVNYPEPVGRGQANRRPALVLQDDGVGLKSPLVLAVPLTTRSGSNRYPAVVSVPANSSNGLKAHSYALVFQLVATDRRWFDGRMSEIDPALLKEVYTSLDCLMGRVSK